MAKKKKEKDEVEDKADEYDALKKVKADERKYYDMGTGEEVKQNKKLDKLWDEVAAKWNQLDKFLTEQGLGQNARKKVVNMVNELDTIKTKILEEKE